MHNLDLGLCKHFWMQTLVDGDLVDSKNLSLCKSILQETTYPTGITRISPDLGSTSGGTPTAAGWSILSRYIMPVLLASSWSVHLHNSEQKMFHSTKKKMVKQGLLAAAASSAANPAIASTSASEPTPTTSDSSQFPTNAQSSAPLDKSRKGKGKAKQKDDKEPKKDKEPEYTKAVSLVTMLEASLVLALACRLAHARIIDETRINLLHRSLVAFATLIASEIESTWIPYNFHIALHIADHIRRHGPAWAFWSYPQERSYGLMKRIRTNKHRGGELEHTMHTRSEDRHRIKAILESTPVTPLSRILRDSIGSEEITKIPAPAHGESQGREESEGTDSDEVGSDNDEPQECMVTLSIADLRRICALANRDRDSGQALFVPIINYSGTSPQLVLDTQAYFVPKLSVGEFTLRPRSKRHGPRSDPSACFVSTATGPRLAQFHSVLRLPYFDERMREQHKRYAVVRVLDVVAWPNGPGFSSSTWNELGYLAAQPSSGVRTILDIDSVLGPAIVLPGSHMFSGRDGVVATMRQVRRAANPSTHPYITSTLTAAPLDHHSCPTRGVSPAFPTPSSPAACLAQVLRPNIQVRTPAGRFIEIVPCDPVRITLALGWIHTSEGGNRPIVVPFCLLTPLPPAPPAVSPLFRFSSPAFTRVSSCASTPFLHLSCASPSIQAESEACGAHRSRSISLARAKSLRPSPARVCPINNLTSARSSNARDSVNGIPSA
ncbi:hypothetical protein CF336_g6928 [Tilletia laevis]|nr:hypothetical protein CF336_g6928 [Tilletia laevis]